MPIDSVRDFAIFEKLNSRNLNKSFIFDLNFAITQKAKILINKNSDRWIDIIFYSDPHKYRFLSLHQPKMTNVSFGD